MAPPRLRRRAIVMIWDGMRPDHVSPSLTPRLHAMAAGGVRFVDAHAMFPTVTRLNAATIATGLTPAGHGIPHNEFVLAGETAARSAANAAHLEALREARGGRILHAPTLAERVRAAGGVTAVVGSGSPGAALLLDPQAATTGGQIFNHAIWAGTSRAEMEAAAGPMPEGALPNTAQDDYFTRLVTEHLLAERGADLVLYWHTDPDRTVHREGVGHPRSLDAIRGADAHLGAILDALDRLGMAAETNVIVTSDHGFSTVDAPLDLDAPLRAAGLDPAAPEPAAVRASTGFVLRGAGRERRDALVRALQAQDGVGVIFSGGRGAPPAPGTLPLDAIGHGGDLAPDVLCSPSWHDGVNAHGWPGGRPGGGAADHGSSSPWEIRSTLVAAGPDLRRGLVHDLPAGNIDIAPTLLHLAGLPGAEALDGRVLHEALVDGPAPRDVAVAREAREAAHGRYRQRVLLSHVGGTTYLDSGTADR